MYYLLLDGSKIPLEPLLPLKKTLDRLEILSELVRADLRLLIRDPTDRLVGVFVENVNLLQNNFQRTSLQDIEHRPVLPR